MWDASATYNGEVIYEWESQTILNPVLRAAFEQANEQLKAVGFSSDNLRIGYLAHTERRLILQRALGRPCFDNNLGGEMHWTPEFIQQLDKQAQWDFPISDIDDWYDDWHEEGSEFLRDALNEVRLFWETCVENNLGIVFSY